MTTIDGFRVSNYSVRAIKIGNKASAQMCEEFEWFNVEHVGEDSVLPTENSASKILEQFKYKPYTLEFRDEFTTGNKPNSLLIMKAICHHDKLVTCKVLEHFVSTTPVVENVMTRDVSRDWSLYQSESLALLRSHLLHLISSQ